MGSSSNSNQQLVSNISFYINIMLMWRVTRCGSYFEGDDIAVADLYMY